MKRLWFIVPVHGRLALAAICLRQLRRTCDELIAHGVDANAVVISDGLTLEQLPDLNFAEVVRDNMYLSRKFNDGIQLATDPSVNPNPADYVVPCGSDDWVDYRLFLEPLPAPDEVFGFQHMSFVREDAGEIAAVYLGYDGGSGIRIIPRELVAPMGYRPADEDRERACDTSILRNIRVHHEHKIKIRHWHLHDRQIVDWKTMTTQLNSYRSVAAMGKSNVESDPFAALAEFYPAESIEEMRDYYANVDASDLDTSEPQIPLAVQMNVVQG